MFVFELTKKRPIATFYIRPPATGSQIPAMTNPILLRYLAAAIIIILVLRTPSRLMVLDRAPTTVHVQKIAFRGAGLSNNYTMVTQCPRSCIRKLPHLVLPQILVFLIQAEIRLDCFC